MFSLYSYVLLKFELESILTVRLKFIVSIISTALALRSQLS